MKRTLAAVTLFSAAVGLVSAQAPASGVAPGGSPPSRASTKVYRTPGPQAANTNGAAANADVSNGTGRPDASAQSAAESPDSVSTAISPDMGGPEAIGQGVGRPTRVPVGPPDDMLDIKPPPPAPNYAWIPGHWIWRNHQWEWLSGRWEIPPRPGLTWYSATYDTHTEMWTDGYWGPDPTPRPQNSVTDTAVVPPGGRRR